MLYAKSHLIVSKNHTLHFWNVSVCGFEWIPECVSESSQFSTIFCMHWKCKFGFAGSMWLHNCGFVHKLRCLSNGVRVSTVFRRKIAYESIQFRQKNHYAHTQKTQKVQFKLYLCISSTFQFSPYSLSGNLSLILLFWLRFYFCEHEYRNLYNNCQNEKITETFNHLSVNNVSHLVGLKRLIYISTHIHNLCLKLNWFLASFVVFSWEQRNWCREHNVRYDILL
jgi:hypothetical protein